MKILVAGGAGYIGSHTAKWLALRGHQVTTLDNLSTGHAEAVRWGELIIGDLLDAPNLQGIFAATEFDAVVHLCARSIVAESVVNPAEYYVNNVVGALNLLIAMRNNNVSKLVFSSTAAVYGAPMSEPIEEGHITVPINPYGSSKLMAEHIIGEFASAYGLKAVVFRYFNAAGASPDADIGESHHPETHLIPNILNSLTGSSKLKVYGCDYKTHDGTCVRDYVHVDDLAHAHELALQYLDRNNGMHTFNLGNGTGFSVLDVLAAAKRVSGRDAGFEFVDRRPGDPDILVASSSRAKSILGWSPKYDSIDAIVETAHRWHRAPAY